MSTTTVMDLDGGGGIADSPDGGSDGSGGEASKAGGGDLDGGGGIADSSDGSVMAPGERPPRLVEGISTLIAPTVVVMAPGERPPRLVEGISMAAEASLIATIVF